MHQGGPVIRTGRNLLVNRHPLVSGFSQDSAHYGTGHVTSGGTDESAVAADGELPLSYWRETRHEAK